MASWFGGGKKEEPVFIQPPQVKEAPVTDPEALKRTGRAALISSSTRGVLGNATTSRKQLSV